MQKEFRVNAGRWGAVLLLPFIWAGAGWSQDLVSKPTTGTGWEADLGRMGFEVPIEELNQGEIVGQKWLAGGECPGFLGAKVYFLAPVPPEKVARAILFFDPTQGKNLLWEDSGSIKIFQRISRPPVETDWARFREALNKLPFDIMVNVQGQKVGTFHLHPDEIEIVSREKSSGWVSVLGKLMGTFQRGGWNDTIAVPAGLGRAVDFDRDLREVLKENGAVRDEFRPILTALAYGGKGGKEKIEINDYWQLMEVDKSPAVALGCGVARAGSGGRWEVADMNYYVSRGYFGSISLYGIWPYGEGKSLVCRIDAVRADSGQLSQATAKMIGESLFLREVESNCGKILMQISGS